VADKIKMELPEALGPKTRRALVRTAARVVLTAPAVTLILSAGTKHARAQLTYGSGSGDAPPGDTTDVGGTTGGDTPPG
jgi:hypothetical protein